MMYHKPKQAKTQTCSVYLKVLIVRKVYSLLIGLNINKLNNWRYEHKCRCHQLELELLWVLALTWTLMIFHCFSSLLAASGSIVLGVWICRFQCCNTGKMQNLLFLLLVFSSQTSETIKVKICKNFVSKTTKIINRMWITVLKPWWRRVALQRYINKWAC